MSAATRGDQNTGAAGAAVGKLVLLDLCGATWPNRSALVLYSFYGLSSRDHDEISIPCELMPMARNPHRRVSTANHVVV